MTSDEHLGGRKASLSRQVLDHLFGEIAVATKSDAWNLVFLRFATPPSWPKNRTAAIRA
jgi:hypothetical protein